MANIGPTSTAAEKARKIAGKYSGEGQSFNVKYLGTQEVSSAKGDAVIADCLKELRTLFRGVTAHLPKVTITLQLSGITVIDDRSKLETIKVPLDHISYVCLDPGDNSVFSFIIRSSDTISSKGLRLHAFVCHPEIAITFNRSARELFDFMARVMKAKKKIAQQQEEAEAKTIDKPTAVQPTLPHNHNQDVVPALAPPPTVSRTGAATLDQSPAAVSLGLSDEEKRQQAVFDEWKQLEKEINDIGKDLGIVQEPVTSTPTSSQTTATPTVASTTTVPQPSITTMNGSNPFDNSFFDLSFGGKESSTSNSATPSAVKEAASQGSTHLFDNPLFNGHLEKTESAPEAELAMPLDSSTPDQSKQLVYSSRARPKGKVLDRPTILSPPPTPTTTTDGGGSRAIRDVSLSPTGEQEVKSILSNTDPFSPTTLNDFQFSPSSNSNGVSMNGSSMFQPGATFSPNATLSSAYFSASSSVLAQDSIQLINPLFTPNGSFTAAPYSPPSQQQTGMPVVMMSPPPALAMQQQRQFVTAMPPPVMMQPAPLTTQIPPDLMGIPAHPMGMLSPALISSPPPMQTGNPNWSPQSPSAKALLDENKDKMFADLLPSTTHPITEKKKEFEPQNKKPVQPTLAQLQENKKKEQEAAFRASNSIDTQKTNEEITEWPPSPFDASSQPSNLFDSLLDGSSPSSTGEQVSITQPQQKAIPLDDFDAAFEEASSKDGDIASAFDMKTEPQTIFSPKVAATNDPFSPTDTVSPPVPKDPTPWSTF